MKTFTAIKTICAASALTLLLGISNAQASTILTFTDNTNPAATFPSSPHNLSPNHPPTGGHYSTGFTSGAEARFIQPDGTPAGGAPLDKNMIDGGETWSFNDAGLMTSVTGTPTNPGANVTGEPPGNGSSVAPTAGTHDTIAQDVVAFTLPMNFLAPTTTSAAGLAYGPASVTTDTGAGTISVFFPILEQQWGDVWFPLGAADNDADTQADGVTFFGTISNLAGCGLGCQTFDFKLFAEETVDDINSPDPGAGDLPDEDPTGAGLWGDEWTAQFELSGSGQLTGVPVPPAFWLLGSGLLVMVGAARRR